MRRPEILVVLGEYLEVSFLDFGAVVNAPCSIASFHRSALIEDFSLSVTHEQGAHYDFKCVSLSESSTAQSSSGETTLFGRESKVPTLALGQDSAAERLVMFRDRGMSAQVRELHHRVIPVWQRLQAADGENWRPSMERSEEYAAWLKLLVDGNPWRHGTYNCVMTLRVRQLSKPVEYRFSFALSDADIAGFRQNGSKWEPYVRSVLLQRDPPMAKPPAYFANPTVQKLE